MAVISQLKKATAASGPAFDKNNITVIFVLGGPGVGKYVLVREVTVNADHVRSDFKARELSVRTWSKIMDSCISLVSHLG
jgi:Cdc6-like AAA superfamily ATPase